jgi:hypothetical protein
MNLLIMHKQRRLVLTVAVIGIVVAAFGTVSSGNGLWISLLVPLSLIVFGLLVKPPVDSRPKTTTSQPTAVTVNKLEEMIKLIELKDQGKISDAEYQERRANLIYYN